MQMRNLYHVKRKRLFTKNQVMILSACLKRLLDCEAITSSLSEFYIFLYVLFSKSRVLSSLLKLEIKFTFSIKTIFSFFF